MLENHGEITCALLLGIGFSSLVSVPSQVLYGGMLALQIISHVPLNSLNLPATTMSFMRYLNNIVSFQATEPYRYMDAKFTPTPPVNPSFGWLGYESRNFLENLGFVALLLIFVATRSICGLVFFLLSRLPPCRCLRTKQSILASSTKVCSSMWVRFFIVTYFEFTIAVWAGLRMGRYLPGAPTVSDNIAILCALISAALVLVFPVIIILAVLLETNARGGLSSPLDFAPAKVESHEDAQQTIE